LEPKKKYRPNIKTKRLNWVKIPPQKIKGTFWMKAHEEKYVQAS